MEWVEQDVTVVDTASRLAAARVWVVGAIVLHQRLLLAECEEVSCYFQDSMITDNEDK